MRDWPFGMFGMFAFYANIDISLNLPPPCPGGYI